MKLLDSKYNGNYLKRRVEPTAETYILNVRQTVNNV